MKLDPRDPVDGRMVNLDEHGKAARREVRFAQTVDEIDLPGRPVQVEGDRMEAGHLPPQLGPVAR